jgi:hypothetical protein
MKKAYHFLLIALLLLIIDLFLTFYYSVNYYLIVGEGNPIATSEYGYLIIFINLAYLISIFFSARYYTNYKTEYIQSKNVVDYVKKLYHGHTSMFIFVNTCFAYIISTFISRTTVILDWIIFAIYKEDFINTSYSMIRNMLPFERYDVYTGFIAFLIAIPLWFKLEYNKTKKTI